MDNGDPFLDIEEPLIIIAKSRPQGGGPFSPIGFQPNIRKLLSVWEVEDLTDIEGRIPSTSVPVNNTKRQWEGIAGRQQKRRRHQEAGSTASIEAAFEVFSQLVAKEVAKEMAKVKKTQSQIIVGGDSDGNDGDSFIDRDTFIDWEDGLEEEG